MGIGNLTELTAADSTGVNAMLIAICQELGVRAVLTTEVIPWARGAVREVDVARRLMHYAGHAADHSEGGRRSAGHDQGSRGARLLRRRAARAAGRHHRSEFPHFRRSRGNHGLEQRALHPQHRRRPISATSSRSSRSTSRPTPSIWARNWRARALPSRSARPTVRKARCRGGISRLPSRRNQNASS